MTKLSILLLTALINGCSAFVSYLAVEEACRQDSVDCGSEEEARRTANRAADKGFELDKEMWQALTDPERFAKKEQDVYLTEVECKDEQAKVCSSSLGCACHNPAF